jgi:hypothetical protein
MSAASPQAMSAASAQVHGETNTNDTSEIPDLIYGAEAISVDQNMPLRKTYYLLGQNAIPGCFKLGPRTYCMSRRANRAAIAAMAARKPA